jgi:hypothetical protein
MAGDSGNFGKGAFSDPGKTLPDLPIIEPKHSGLISGALLGGGVTLEGAATGLLSGITTSTEAGGLHYTLKLTDGIDGAFRSSIGALGVNLFDIALSQKFHSDLFKPSVPESLAMGVAFGLSDTRMRLAAIGGAWLFGRAYNYASQELFKK